MEKVIFFVKRFPVLSQTFVIEQINSLIELGLDVEIVTQQKEKQSIELDSLLKHKLIERTSCITPDASKTNSRLFKAFFLSKFVLANMLVNTKLRPLAKLVFSLLKKRKSTLAFEIAMLAKHSQNNLFKADAIIAHFGQNGVIAQCLKEANILSGELFTVFHGYEISEYESIDTWKDHYVALSKNSTLLPISEYWKQRLISWGAIENNIKVHRMGVDVTKFVFQDKPLNKPIKIVSVGRATEKKGLVFAIRAMQYLDDNFHLEIVGDGALHSELVKCTQDLGLEDKVTFHGAKPPEFIKNLLVESDVFLLPSITDSNGDMEGIPVALMEAMASGLVVVSTFHSGIPELIENGKGGFLVPEKDELAIAETISKLPMLSELSKIRIVARKQIELNYNKASLAKKLERLIIK